MISGDELQDARARAGLTRREVAELVGASEKSVYNWETGSVPRNKEARVRDALGMGSTQTDGDSPLHQASDVALLAELGRRLADRGDGHGDEHQKILTSAGIRNRSRGSEPGSAEDPSMEGDRAENLETPEASDDAQDPLYDLPARTTGTRPLKRRRGQRDERERNDGSRSRSDT